MLHPPYILDTPRSQIGGWEIDYYLGLVGFVFMFYFGVIRNWMKEKDQRSLYLPMLAMIFLSMGNVYLPLFNSSIPFMDSQRAPTRFALIPIVFLLILAAVQFQPMLKEWGRDRWKEKIIVLFGLAFCGFDLYRHSISWRLSTFSTDVLEKHSDTIQVAISNHVDSSYLLAVVIGLLVTLFALTALIVLATRESKRLNSLQPELR
jgi:NADH:ubiquinone oxidoreductase subunit 6 (subunit J)